MIYAIVTRYRAPEVRLSEISSTGRAVKSFFGGFAFDSPALPMLRTTQLGRALRANAVVLFSDDELIK